MADEKKQGITQIEALINEGKFKEAYNVCNKLLLNFPESRKIRKLQKKIEKTVYERNLRSVKNDLKNLKPLWKEKRYRELVEKLEVLSKYVPGYTPVEKDLFKARQQLQKEQEGAVEDYIKNIEMLIKENKFEEAITKCRKFLGKNSGYQRVALLENKARDLLVVRKLKENKDLLKSKKFKEIEEFLNDLLRIKPGSSKVKALLNKASKRETVALSYEKKDFAYRSLEYIKVLMQKKKWEKSINAFLELLKVDPQNLKALELLDKARKKFDEQLTKEVIIKTKELQKKFRDQKKQNPKNFIRL